MVFNKGLHRCKTQASEEDLISTTAITQVEVASTLEVAFKGEFSRITMDSQLKAIYQMSRVTNPLSATIWVDSKVKDRIFKEILRTIKQ